MSIEVTSVVELATVVADQPIPESERIVVAIAGPPGAGKSTTANRLVEVLNEASPGAAAVFPMDGYHFDDSVLEARGWRAVKGAPHTFDVAGFAHMLNRLRRNDESEVAVPVFDREIEIARAGARIIAKSVRYLVAEGNYLLLDRDPWVALRGQFDLTVFIPLSEDELHRRLVIRWSDLTPEQLHNKLEGNDLRNARLVLSNSSAADISLIQ